MTVAAIATATAAATAAAAVTGYGGIGSGGGGGCFAFPNDEARIADFMRSDQAYPYTTTLDGVLYTITLDGVLADRTMVDDSQPLYPGAVRCTPQ